MSKAEDRALEYCCSKCSNNKRNCGMKLLSNGRDCIECGNFIKGYHQAEKDLELTWEDIKLLIDIIDSENLKPHLFDEIDYQEVLKRFKDFKERKQQ